MEVTRFPPLVGRMLVGLPLLVSGFGKLAAFGPTTAYISSVGLPLAPLGWAIAIAFEVGGGLLLILGFRVREVASGFECGIGLSDFQDLKEGDLIETYEEREIART